MIVAVSVFELHIPEARSLKEKRKVVKTVVERVHSRFRVSIAETDHHDLHQRAEIAIAAVAKSEGEGRHIMDRIRDLIDEIPGGFVTLWDPQWIEGF